MGKDKIIPKMRSFDEPLLYTAITAGILGYIGKEMNKMFGETKIPEGMVREIIQGVMDGLLMYFDDQIGKLKKENDELKKKIEELESGKKK